MKNTGNSYTQPSRFDYWRLECLIHGVIFNEAEYLANSDEYIKNLKVAISKQIKSNIEKYILEKNKLDESLCI